MNKDIFNYALQIPTKIMLDIDYFPYDNISSFDQAFSNIDDINLSCNLINERMNALTQNLMHYNANYPDLLANYIYDEKLRKAVKSITYDKAVANINDNYNLVFNITSALELNNNLRQKLINYMAGQMSDGLLENGLTLAQNIKNPDYDDEDEYDSDDEYCNIMLFPEWNNTNSYKLCKN